MAEPAARDEWGNVDDEGDLCRVCRTEAEDSKPLIYPCKCSGSVRYVHSDCLQEWLSHSRKRYCEICGHPYTFTKVYPSSLPSTIPAIVYVRQSLFVAGRVAWRVVRICIAIISWLVVLPCITMLCLRVIIAGADNLTFASLSYGLRNAISDSYYELNATWHMPNGTDGRSLGRDLVMNAIATNGTLDFLPSFWDRMAADVRNPIAFVFRGQIVAISVSTGLIGLILLREWIAQQEWHARPPAEEEGEIDPTLWAFRNGQAIRLTDLVLSDDGESNRADAGDDIGDTGDAETIIADGDQEPEPTVVEQEEIDLSGEGSTAGAPEGSPGGSWERKPARPVLSHAAFDASRRVGEAASAPRSPLWEGNADAGPSRGFADVPEDVVTDTPSEQVAVSAPPSLEAPGVAEHGSTLGDTYHDEDFFEALETVASIGASSETTSDFSPSFRRASDPGPDGNSHEGLRPERQFGSQGVMDPALPIITESPPDTPPEDQQAYNTRMGALLGVQEGGEGPSSPESVGTPETGEFEDEGEDELFGEDGRDRRPISPTDLVRTETEDMETDGDADQETDANADMDVEIDHIDEVVEVEDPQWRQWEDHPVGDEDDGFVVNVEMVQQVMARNELEGVGMDIIPDDEDDRPLDAEDWDGIFEVVGFIGPLTGLLHNHIFVSFAMAFTLAVLVGLPVIIGKIVLSTDFIRASGDAFIATIRSISFVSDCIIFGATWILKELLAFPRFITKPATDYLMDALNMTSSDIGYAFNFTTHIWSHSVVTTETIMPTNYTVELPIVGAMAEKTVDGLELLGETAHHMYKAMRLVAISIAASPDASDQLLSLVVGYLTLSVSVICIAIIDAANLLQLSHSFMEKARNVQTFLKVVFFMTLEIVCFPVFVGLIMDLCTLPLFGATVSARLARIAVRPFGTLFVTWACGTVFMISFAAFLTHMRTISRAGALYFIRDPSDPTHSPVKEIMDRPALAQFPRLAVSATMYTVVVFAACGAVPWLVHALSILPPLKGFLPLRLEQRPLSSVPFDVLFLHLVLPPSWEMLYLPHRLRKLFVSWWGFAVRKLRLVSLIFGLNAHPRPLSPVSHFMWLVMDAACQFIFGKYDNRATRARVPASDRVELATLAERRREGVFIPVDHRGAPRTEADRIRLLKQDRAARKAGRNPELDYTIVTLPDFWRTRVYALLAFMLFSSSCVTAGALFVPLAIGRQATATLFDGPVYDGYSWIVGVYLCLVSYNLGQSAKKHIVDSSRAERLRRSQKSTRVKRWILGVVRGVYAVFMLCVVVPLVVGINFELFISLPARYGFSSDVSPVLHVWDAWAAGTAMISLYVGGVGLAGDEAPPRGPPTFRDAFKRPLRQKFAWVTRLCVPLIGWLLIPIAVPWLVFVSLRTALQVLGVPLPQVENGWAFRMMYPITTTALLAFVSWRVISSVVTRVRQWMIDAEYVVEERVENYEPGAEVDGGAEWAHIDPMGVVEADAMALGNGGNGNAEAEEDWEDVVVLEA